MIHPKMMFFYNLYTEMSGAQNSIIMQNETDHYQGIKMSHENLKDPPKDDVFLQSVY